MNTIIEKHKNVLFVIFFITASIFLHIKDYNKLPTSIHAWAQSDHYALALGFYNDGMDFFHPTTFALDHQFPPEKQLENPQGITATDFPILHYTVAILMKAFHTTSPWVFRMFALLISFIALFYLFRTVSETKNIWMALFITAFVFFQPIYVYYQDGFHPCSTAFNVLIIGICFLIRYYSYGKTKHFLFGILFLTLAALIRFTQIITLLSLLGAYGLTFLKNKKEFKHIVVIIGGIIVIMGYFIYNKYLAAHYGSVFLGAPVVAHSLSELTRHLIRIVTSYSRGFLPFLHLFVFGIIGYTFFKYKKEDKGFNHWKLFLMFSFIGTIIFSLLMTYHLSAHDYYSIDTWLPVLFLTIIYLIYNTDDLIYKKELLPILVLIFTVGAFSIAVENQIKKYRDDVIISGPTLVINDFKNSADFLNSHINSNDDVLIICASGWNTPMVGWQRKAFREEGFYDANIHTALNRRKYDYIVTHNATFRGFADDNIPYANFIGTNNKVSIWQYVSK